MASNGYSQGHTLVSKGARNLRQRLTFATITGRSIRVEAIREDAEKPGLHSHEASLLRLLEKVTNGSVVEINETGECASISLLQSRLWIYRPMLIEWNLVLLLSIQ